MIAKYITFAVIFIFFIIGVISTLTIMTNKDPVKYSIYNTIKFQTINKPYKYRNIIQTPDVLGVGFSNVMAKACCNLIENIYIDNMKVDNMKVHKIISYSSGDKFIYILSRGDVIFVVLRGTLHIQEWINNFKFHQNNYNESLKTNVNTPLFMKTNENIKIHSGFLSTYSRVYTEILDTISELNKISQRQICFSGHSMGGSIAILLGLEFARLGYVTDVYAFGSPRVGNVSFSDYVTKSTANIYRVENTEDAISQSIVSVAPNMTKHDEPYFYSHCGEEHYFTTNWFSIHNNHSIQIYDDAF